MPVPRRSVTCPQIAAARGHGGMQIGLTRGPGGIAAISALATWAFDRIARKQSDHGRGPAWSEQCIECRGLERQALVRGGL